MIRTREREREKEKEWEERERKKEGGYYPPLQCYGQPTLLLMSTISAPFILFSLPFYFTYFYLSFFFFWFILFQILSDSRGWRKERERERERRQPPMLICIRPTDWLADDDITQLQPSQYYNKLIHCYEFIFHTRFGQYYWSDLGVTSVRPKSVCFDVMRLKKNRQYKVIQFMRLIQLWLHSHTHTHTYTLYKNI